MQATKEQPRSCSTCGSLKGRRRLFGCNQVANGSFHPAPDGIMQILK
jgi:hypothetical protein